MRGLDEQIFLPLNCYVLVETVLAILVVSVITSAGLSLFSSILFNLEVQKLATDLQMCEISESAEHLGFNYEQENEGDEVIKKMGPISANADVIDKTIKRMKQKYNDCKFIVEDKEVNLGEYKNKKITGYFCIGTKKS